MTADHMLDALNRSAASNLDPSQIIRMGAAFVVLEPRGEMSEDDLAGVYACQGRAALECAADLSRDDLRAVDHASSVERTLDGYAIKQGCTTVMMTEEQFVAHLCERDCISDDDPFFGNEEVA